MLHLLFRLRRQLLLLGAVAALLCVGMLPAHALQDVSFGYEEWDCPFGAVDGVSCGYLTVPEDRTQPDGNVVELAVAIISPWGANPDPTPVIYLDGGPGDAPLITTDGFLTEPIVENHTLILFDQRGTGFSIPSLNCPELEDDQTSDTDPLQACRDRLQAEGVDLQMYNSAASAADVADLVAGLGYEQVNLWGISYGTKLGLTILRDYPEVVQSAVLDSVYAPEADDLQLQSTAVLDSLDELFARCAADSACNEVYPDLGNDFYALLDQLDAQPLEFDYDGEAITLDGATLYDKLFQTLYDTQALPFLPYAIELLVYGQNEQDYADAYAVISDTEFPIMPDFPESDIAPVADSDETQAYIDEYGQIDDSEGMAYSVDCQEEYQLDESDTAYSLADSAPAPLNSYMSAGIQGNLDSCDIWGVQTADPIEAERVISDVPTLLFAGRFDPITPVSSAESALEGLSNGQLLVFPSAGHGITFTQTDSGMCAKELMLAFFDDPSAPLDMGCIDATSAIEFYTG